MTLNYLQTVLVIIIIGWKLDHWCGEALNRALDAFLSRYNCRSIKFIFIISYFTSSSYEDAYTNDADVESRFKPVPERTEEMNCK